MVFFSSTLPDPDTLHPLLAPEETTGIIWWIYTLGCGGAERQLIVAGREFALRGIPVALACQRLLNYRGDLHYLSQALETFSTVHDLTAISHKWSRRCKRRRKEIGYELAEAWKAKTESNFFQPSNLYALARKALFREAVAPAMIPGERAQEAARGAALPFRDFFDPKEYAALEHHIACFAELKPALLHVWDADELHVPVAAVLAGVPKIIVSARVNSPQQRAAKGLPTVDVSFAHEILSWLLRFKNVALAANSKVVADDFGKWLDLDAGAVAVTPNIFEAEQWPSPPLKNIAALRQRLGIPGDAQVIGGLARFAPQKNPELWIKTVSRVLEQKQDVYAVLGGKGKMLKTCRHLAAKMPEGGRIILPGLINEVPEFYGMLSVFLLTSRSEGLPNVLLEAQYAGVPVVSTDAGGASEIVCDGISGWIVESRDYKQLAERIVFVLEDHAWARQAKDIATRRIAECFSANVAISRVLDLYNGHA